MRSVRRDPLTGRWVVLATERVVRPMLGQAAILRDPGPTACPFCPGNEAATRTTLDQVDDADGAWRSRAFPNLYPALVVEESLGSRGVGPYDELSGTGAHEVVVLTPHHGSPWSQPEDLGAALCLLRDRMRDLEHDRRLVHLQAFANLGARAGASQPHPHAQLVGLPFVPAAIQTQVERCRAWTGLRGRPLLDDMVAHDRHERTRCVEVGAPLVVCPWAPQLAYETWIVPEVAGPFRDTPDRVLMAVGAALGRLGTALHRVAGPVDLNLLLVTAPREAYEAGFRWFLRVTPRPHPFGGFELATDCAFNGVPPEAAAAALREAWPERRTPDEERSPGA